MGKTATLPSLRVTPALRDEVESVLQEGESISAFLEQALRQQIARRLAQKAFVDRGLAAGAQAAETGHYASREEVTKSLRAVLERAKAAQ